VSRNDGDVMFFTSNMFLTQHSHGTAAAAKQTAATPNPTFPTAIDGFRAVGNATGAVKKVSKMIRIHHFLI
jgi:hypothetical protein